MHEGAELLISAPMARRGRRMLEALAATIGPRGIVVDHYTGTRKLLVMYGVGLPERYTWMRTHIKAGGHVACLDLGYWDRDESMRVSIDDLHPTAEQLMMAPDASRKWPALSEVAKSKGPVLLVGMGRKSVHMYGLKPFEWEKSKVEQIRINHPGRKILWRPKGRDVEPISGTEMCETGTIAEILNGCSVVVCRHSNVAVDACIAGVPVECEGGAALALYGPTPYPTQAQRAEFLSRLAWWQWRPKEAVQAWDWIRRATS